MKLLLQHRILIGYIILIAVIGSMAAIMFYERNRVQNIESEITRIREANRTINAAHRHITVLATLGESAITWDDEDYQRYQLRRLKIDSILQILQRDHEDFVPAEQIDTLRLLLVNKEKHLHQAMQVFQQYDSLLLEHLPAIAQQARSFRTVTRKKKGLAGFFGGKETVQIPTSSKTLHSLNEQFISMEQERQQAINAYMDSLRVQNRELNRKLYVLIQDMDEQTQATFQGKEMFLKKSHDRSIMVITGLISSAIVLLVVSYWIIQRDIREKARTKREMEELIEKLRQSVKKNKELLTARRQIMQTIIHELRSPLSAISGNTELIIADTDETERTRHIQAIRQSVRRMASMLADLLNFFRLDNGKEQVCPKPFQLQCIINTLKHEFTPRTEKKHLAFHIEACETEVVVGDKNMILRIGSNLLSNAIKFTKKGEVRLHIRYEAERLVLTVTDTGIGMSNEQLRQIYNPFERFENAEPQEGFGLGMSITLALVKLLKGEIRAESKPGFGSMFTVTLPLPLYSEELIQQQKKDAIRLPRNMRIAVVENDAMVLKMAARMLSGCKVKVDACSNAGKLMEKLRSIQYDLIITDIMMPDINGYGLLELLRASNIGNAKCVPVLAMTARVEQSAEEFKKVGFAGCVYKPFSCEELINAILACVKQYQSGNKDIDFSVLLTGEDDDKEMLELLIRETEKNMAELMEAVKRGDKAKVSALVHHLLSTWELLRIECPLIELRRALSANDMMDETVHEAVKKVEVTAGMLVEQAEEMIKEAKV